MNGAQQQILDMLRTRGAVWSREFIRECEGWDFRKSISRLRRIGHRLGFTITNISTPGQEARYVYREIPKPQTVETKT